MILNVLGRYGTSFHPASNNVGTFGFSASGQFAAMIFVAEKTMTITQFGMCVNNSSGTPPIRIAMWQYGNDRIWTPTTKIYTDANPISTTAGITEPTFVWWNLTTPQTVTRGQVVTIGLESYGTWSGALNVVQFQEQGKRDYINTSGQPYGYTSSSGANYSFRWGVATATETYGYPVSQSGSQNFNAPSVNTQFSGTAFTVPTSMGATCKLQGVICQIQADSNYSALKLNLYNATSYPPTLITSKVISAGGVGQWQYSFNWQYQSAASAYIPFDTEQVLNTGTKYLVGFEASVFAGNIGKLTFNRAQDANCLSDVPSFGVTANMITNTWTESGLFRYAVSPDVTDFAPAAGSSGGGSSASFTMFNG